MALRELHFLYSYQSVSCGDNAVFNQYNSLDASGGTMHFLFPVLAAGNPTF